MLKVHQLRRVFDSAMREKDSFLIFEVLERLDFLGLQDEYDDWSAEALPVLAEIKLGFQEDYEIYNYAR
jgi:hypothetical protein